MKHIFLFGERQIGKSTLIETLLRKHPEWNIGGFLTVSAFDEKHLRHVHMIPAFERATPLTAQNEVGTCDNGKNSKGFPEAFNRIGVPLLENRRCALLIMDEVGHLEKEAIPFQEAVFSALEGDIPVLGVIKPKDVCPTPYTRQIWDNPDIEKLSLTAENREEMLSLVEKELLALLKEAD